MVDQVTINDFCSTRQIAELNNEYNLKISSKKLKSGKCQVKFFATVRQSEDLHGYVLVEADQTLKNVVSRINDRLRTIDITRDFRHIHLYSIGQKGQDDMSFIFFDK